ncbi:plakophilin-1 [Hippoglossus hippoglossus]|uniref:plakophilin-1 n=1 Tax=Hippoglossus hippoglossus TaxID=8267 RepID=UPI00148DC482|nr:plakophilin-1 [Hippoglossus hippoglossus]
MTALEPLRSAMTVGSGEDTSLALPSDKKLRTGQQRVLEQVHTIKRGKSKSWKNGQPTPSHAGLFQQSLTSDSEFGTFKFTPSKANGTFSHSNSSMSAGHNKANFQKSRSLSNKVSRGRYQSTSGGWEQHMQGSNWPQGPNGMKTSRSDPALVPQYSGAPAPVMRAKGQAHQSQHSIYTSANRHSTYSMTNGTPMTNSQTRIVQQPSAHSYTEGRMGTMKTTKIQLQQSAVDSGINVSELTLKEAVENLSHPDESFQQCGATFIQHTTFKEELAKQEVFQLGGIPLLVTLLRSPSPGVGQAAAGALRNLVFKDKSNKLEVQHCGGIGKALQLLKESDSTETQKQITGLLWNMSSTDELKGELTATALPALTENVVVPFTCWSDNSANNNIHPDVFCNATGCLRNLSCGQQRERKAMRECNGLIDSLMSYIQSCVAEDNPDDKSVESCACILHNLSYQLEKESPTTFDMYRPQIGNQLESKKSSAIGCFSPRSGKVQKEFLFDVDRAMPEDSTPSGEELLCHPKAMKTYLSLLGSSQKDATLEACCGTLRNLTASNGLGSMAVTRILAQKLGALPHISPLLKSSNGALQKAAVSLLSNMCQTCSVQPTMAKQILPDLTSLLSSGPREMGNSDNTISAACHTARALMLAEPEISKKVINNELVTSLADLSENGSFPKGSKAASLLLYNLWNEKTLQGAVKKLGLAKTLFVNSNTTAVHRSAQIID